MRQRIGEHVVLVTLVLSAVSLALVFGAAMQRIPADLLPMAPAWVFELIPHANVILSISALGAMTRGYLAINRRDIEQHRRSMLIAFGAFGIFLALYLYKVAVEGTATFPGPETVHLYVYLPLLIVHIGLAIICLPLLFYVLLLALTRPIAAIPETHHAKVARPALLLWAISFILGITVYLQLYVIF